MPRPAASFLLATLVAGLFGAASCPAQPLNLFGAEANGSVADCPSFCTNFDFPGGSGGPSSTLADFSFTAPRGSGDAFSALSGPTSTPVLKTRAAATAGLHGTFSNAFASQGYTYNGPAKTLTLAVSLTGSIDDPESPSESRLSSTVAVFAADGYEYITDAGTILFESSAQLLQQSAGGNALVDFFATETGAVAESASMSFDVEDGDQFYVWSKLNAFAGSSTTAAGSVDAFNTLGATFLDPTGLTPAATAVPAPAGGVLLALAVAIVSGYRRRL